MAATGPLVENRDVHREEGSGPSRLTARSAPSPPGDPAGQALGQLDHN